jgi:Na+-transporting methylmalonyl-CoA/oxaloacetate decarboxylase gamma subunit
MELLDIVNYQTDMLKKSTMIIYLGIAIAFFMIIILILSVLLGIMASKMKNYQGEENGEENTR